MLAAVYTLVERMLDPMQHYLHSNVLKVLADVRGVLLLQGTNVAFLPLLLSYA